MTNDSIHFTVSGKDVPTLLTATEEVIQELHIPGSFIVQHTINSEEEFLDQKDAEGKIHTVWIERMWKSDVTVLFDSAGGS